MGLVLYVLALYWLALSYRRLHSKDERSLAFQRRVDERAMNSKLIPSRTVLEKLLLIGMAAFLILIAAYVVKVVRLFGHG
jgi:hypothetical protein